jgi:hypothetical protein
MSRAAPEQFALVMPLSLGRSRRQQPVPGARVRHGIGTPLPCTLHPRLRAAGISSQHVIRRATGRAREHRRPLYGMQGSGVSARPRPAPRPQTCRSCPVPSAVIAAQVATAVQLPHGAVRNYLDAAVAGSVRNRADAVRSRRSAAQRGAALTDERRYAKCTSAACVLHAGAVPGAAYAAAGRPARLGRMGGTQFGRRPEGRSRPAVARGGAG